MKNISKLEFIIVFAITGLALFGFPKASQARDEYPDNLELATVQAAVDQVYDAGGGTVYLMAGSITWPSTLYVPGKVNIIGAGSPMITQGVDQKWIPEPTTIITVNGNTAIAVNHSGHTQSYNSVRIANIKFLNTVHNGTFVELLNAPISRIDHCVFQGNESLGASMYQVGMDSVWSDPSAATTGVIDHCNFVWGDYGLHVGPRLWINNKPLGTSDAVYVEDNYFNSFGHPISGFNGAHWVFRHNYVTSHTYADGGWGYGIDAHGPYFEDLGGAGAGQYRGTNVTETYNNYFDSPPSVNNGGTADNWGALRLRSGVGVIWGNTFKQHRHAVIFTEDSYTCSHSGLDSPHNFYIWNNTLINISENPYWYDGLGCTPTYITFGTGGIMVDTPMPGYTPYTYPHPLTLGDGGDITPPSAPQGLTVE